MSDKEIEFKRTMGGLAWPGSAPGAVVILGQEYRFVDNFPKENELQILYHLIAFFESDDLSVLIKTAQRLKWAKDCEDFFARLTHKPGVDFLELWNREALKNRHAVFHLTSAPYTDQEEHHRRGNIEAHLTLLREYLRPEKKRLIGIQGTKLAAYLNEIPRAVTKLTDLDYPGVSALAYALAGIVPTEHYDQENREAESYLREFDLYDD